MIFLSCKEMIGGSLASCIRFLFFIQASFLVALSQHFNEKFWGRPSVSIDFIGGKRCIIYESPPNCNLQFNIT